MPDAPLRPCAGGCGAKVKAGRCSSCTQKGNQRRRQGRALTYSEPWWLAFRRTFIGLLVNLGIVPVCGAALPDGPATNPSLCKQQGWLTLAARRGSLHLHHEPSLTTEEQKSRDIVCDPRRIVLLCDACHNAETDRTRGERVA